MYDVQKHPMHTKIQQHTYRRKNSSYTAMPTAIRKILSTSWNVQFGWFFEDFTQFWVFLYGCPVLTNDAG
jgi:hypothetical protein